MDIGYWFYIGFDFSCYRSDLMRYKSLEILSPLINFGVVFFIAFKNMGTACLNFGDINYSIAVLILSIVIQLVNFKR